MKSGSPYPSSKFSENNPDVPRVASPLLFKDGGLLQSLQGSAEFEAFRPILMDLDPRVGEYDLLHQLRSEAVRLLPCDTVSFAFCSDGLLQIFDKSHGHQSSFVSLGSRTSSWIAPQTRLVSENLSDSLGHASGVQAPFSVNGGVAGTISFLTKTPQLFRESDKLAAQRISDSIGLILSKARNLRRENNSEPTATCDWKEDLVAALCEVPDIHRILPKISSLLRSAIPHDRLTISFHDRDRNMSMRSVSNDDGPTFNRVCLSRDDFPKNGSSVIINDLPSHRPSMEPSEFHPKVLDAGYRSFLVTHVWAGQHGLGFVFWSKQKDAFQRHHVPSAQQISDLCAVAESRERLAPRIESSGTKAEGGPVARDAQTRKQERPNEVRIAGDEYSRQRSAAWMAVVRSATQVAATDSTVLLVGETGTGKEVVARLIYAESARKNGPFVAVNCAALPDTLLESELFGFERGAFTGAYHQKRGYIEVARRGILFLDELAEMSLGAQAKLLRVLETREYQPLGSARPQKAEIRVIAATNRDLREEVRARRFRADLYYRLCVFEISLPPLRSRKEDILPLAYKFLLEVNSGASPTPLTLSARAEEALLNYQWPGNVRELRNVIERASILCESDVIDVGQLNFQEATARQSAENEISVVERKMIERVLRECGGNKALAARTLGLSRTQLYVRLRRYSTISKTPHF
jgi:transcriptional regulator with GAF, ATPase, and Fis domain